MTNEEASKAIKDAKRNHLEVHFDKDHKKSGKSHDRYEFYKHITTFEQIQQAIKNKKNEIRGSEARCSTRYLYIWVKRMWNV